MTEEERNNMIARLPADMVLWPDDKGMPYMAEQTVQWWFEHLGHPPAHSAGCTCGCAPGCLLGLFFNSTVASVVRELDRLGALRPAAEGSSR